MAAASRRLELPPKSAEGGLQRGKGHTTAGVPTVVQTCTTVAYHVYICVYHLTQMIYVVMYAGRVWHKFSRSPSFFKRLS